MFFATGEAQPVERIASTLHRLGESQTNQMMIGAAARWSLTANAKQHPRVRQILVSLRKRARPDNAQYIEEILNQP